MSLCLASNSALAGKRIDIERIVAPGSYAVSPDLPMTMETAVQNGDRYGDRQIAHQAGWRWGEQRISSVMIGTDEYRLISHAGADLTPDRIEFATVQTSDAAHWQHSAAVPIQGISEPVPIAIRNGEYRLDDGAFTSANGWAHVGQQLQLRQLSGSELGSRVTTQIQLGNSKLSFQSVLADTDPQPFTFTAVTGAALNSAVTSNAITVSGIDMPSPISVVGGTYSVNGGAYTNVAGTVNSGDVVYVRLTTSSGYSEMSTATLTIGTVSAAFNVTTMAYGGGGGGDDDDDGYGGGGGSTSSLMLVLTALLACYARRRRHC